MKKVIAIIMTILMTAMIMCGCGCISNPGTESMNNSESASITVDTNADKDKSKPDVDIESEIDIIENTQHKDKYVFSLDFDFEDGYMLEKMAVAEAEDVGVECMAAVMMVILNRTWSPDFPMSVEEVIKQDKQFTPMWNGRYDEVEPNEDSREALNMIMHGWDEINGALYFESCDGESWHSRNLEYVTSYGNMRFYK